MDIILASASPRRKEIFENVNLKFRIEKSDINEAVHEKETPQELVMRLSYEKASDIAEKNPDSIVIGADTVVCYDGRILGKPSDIENAFDMIRMLSGKEHEVITGFSIINLSENKKVTDFCVSRVKFRTLSDEEIKDYISTGEYRDKAGAYGIQGFGALLVEYIKGDYFNIVGFPLSDAAVYLRDKFGINILKESGLSE